MIPEWKTFLDNKGAEFYDDIVDSFGNPVRERRTVYTGDVFADLSHFGLIAVTGQDAATFLQGQTTNDINIVTTDKSSYNALCNAKGRVIVNFRVFKRDETIYLRIPADMVEDTLQRLRMYVLRAKVNLENANNHFVCIGLSGPRAEQELTAYKGISVPQDADAVTHTSEFTVIRVQTAAHPRFIIYGKLGAMKKLWETLDVRCGPIGTSPWQLLDIQAGIPVIRPETSELFVPQMINLQHLGAVSFKKGCYTGQEVVARMQYLGKLKRQMYRAHIKTEQKPLPGSKIYSPGHEQSCGTIVNSQPAGDGGHDVLAVLEIETASQHPLHWDRPDGPQLMLEELPYSLGNPTLEASE